MKNPKECFSMIQNQSFFILNELTAPECKDGSEPLLFHHETFSRFVFVIINAEKKATTANIPVHVIPGIIEDVKMARMMEKMHKKEAAAEPEKSSAYTVVITAGRLKGKTPAAVLLQDAETNLPFLENQKKWLTQNLGRYPKNAVQIDAIDEALSLYHAGKLDASANSAGPVSERIFGTGMRPLVRRTRKDGKSFVYEIEINWNGGTAKPVEVKIKNYYAPVIKNEKGLLNVVGKEAADVVVNSFSMTYEEWCWAAHMLETNIRNFEMLNASRNYKIAENAARENVREANVNAERMRGGGAS